MSKERNGINIGNPVLWMVDPVNPGVALGVVYEFSVTGERLTVWYTEDGCPEPSAQVLTPEDLRQLRRS